MSEIPTGGKQKPHAKLSLELYRHLDGKTLEIELQGCQHHLVEAIAEMLQENETFKQFWNQVVRKANELRASKEN
jgi:hypothetical protein